MGGGDLREEVHDCDKRMLNGGTLSTWNPQDISYYERRRRPTFFELRDVGNLV